MYSRILVPIDNSALARRALEEAVALAKALAATVRVLHVVDLRALIASGEAYAPPEDLLAHWKKQGEELVATSLARLGDQGVAMQASVLCDPALRICDAILNEAGTWDAGLIVMGTHGRSGLTRLVLGSEAEAVLRESPVPVLLVRTAERQLPH